CSHCPGLGKRIRRRIVDLGTSNGIAVERKSPASQNGVCIPKTSMCLRGWELYFFDSSLFRCSFFLPHSFPLCSRSSVHALPLSWRTWPCGTKSACCNVP